MGNESKGFATMARENPTRHKKVSAVGGKAVAKDKNHMRRISLLGVAARTKAKKKK